MYRKLVFIMGKGGVGKTALAQAVAQRLAGEGKKVLLCEALPPVQTEQTLRQSPEGYWHLSLNPSDCFKEYIILKLKIKPLYTVLLGSKIIQYFEKAAPGIKELVVIGKIWFETNNYDHVIVDMPSTGYALTMLNTPANFAALFPGGPIYRDADDMTKMFGDATQTSHLIVSLAEEMPIQESIELAQSLKQFFPKNRPYILFNRVITNPPEFKEGAKISALRNAFDYFLEKEKEQQRLIENFFKEIKDKDLFKDDKYIIHEDYPEEGRGNSSPRIHFKTHSQ